MKQFFEPVVIGPFSPNIQFVSQIGAIDLREAYANSVVPGSIEETEVDYNGIDDPKSIIGRPDDIFAAKRAFDTYNNMSSGASDKTDVSAPSEV